MSLKQSWVSNKITPWLKSNKSYKRKLPEKYFRRHRKRFITLPRNHPALKQASSFLVQIQCMEAKRRFKIWKKCSKGKLYSVRDATERLHWHQRKMKTVQRRGTRAKWLWRKSFQRMPLTDGCPMPRSRPLKKCSVNMAEATSTRSRAWFQLPGATLTSWLKLSTKQVQIILRRKMTINNIRWQDRSKSRKKNWNV